MRRKPFQVCRRRPLRPLSYWRLYIYSVLEEITRQADSLMQVCLIQFRTSPWKWLMVKSNITQELKPGIALVGSLSLKSNEAQSRVRFFFFFLFGFVAEGKHMPWLGALWLFFSSACWLRSQNFWAITLFLTELSSAFAWSSAVKRDLLQANAINGGSEEGRQVNSCWP